MAGTKVVAEETADELIHLLEELPYWWRLRVAAALVIAATAVEMNKDTKDSAAKAAKIQAIMHKMKHEDLATVFDFCVAEFKRSGFDLVETNSSKMTMG